MRKWLFVRIPLGFILASIALVMLLRWVPVRYTPVMLKRAFQFRDQGDYRSEQEWVSLEEISPELIHAVILAEDQKFWQHKGFDWKQLGAMWMAHRQEGARLRGCSTISQQTAKNVFTFGTRSWVRKGLEAWWTVLIELLWSKERILEVYLNVAEMGKGLYGAEVASQYFFGVPASELNPRQAVSIALCLPSPLSIHPDYLPAHIRKRFARIIHMLNSS